MAKVSVDKEKCIGCGACVSVCEKTFEMGEDNKAHVKSQPKKITCEKEATETCPVNAIKIS